MSFIARRRDRPTPSASGRRSFASVAVPNNTFVDVGIVYGAGYCEWFRAEMYSETFYVYVDIDGVEAFRGGSLSNLNNLGHTATTPAVQLLKYGTAGALCVLQSTLRFEFRNNIKFRAFQNSGAGLAISLEALVNLVQG